jgi:CPA1 family monovalent cation:H+ antiporter
MLDAERAALRELLRERAYPADVLRTLQREIDLDESRVQARGRA